MNDDNTQEKQDTWHLDKRVPVAIIVTIVMQFTFTIWYAAQLDHRVATMERNLIGASSQGERLTKVETEFNSVKQELQRRLDRIDIKLDRLLEK
jgi:hypothetical protein